MKLYLDLTNITPSKGAFDHKSYTLFIPVELDSMWVKGDENRQQFNIVENLMPAGWKEAFCAHQGKPVDAYRYIGMDLNIMIPGMNLCCCEEYPWLVEKEVTSSLSWLYVK